MSFSTTNAPQPQQQQQRTPPFAAGFAMGGLLPNGWLAFSLHHLFQELQEEIPELSLLLLLLKSALLLAVVFLMVHTTCKFPRQSHCQVWLGTATGLTAFTLLAVGCEAYSPGLFASPMVQFPLVTALAAFLALAVEQAKQQETIQQQQATDEEQLTRPLVV